GSQTLDDNSNRSSGSKSKPNESTSAPASPPRAPRGRGGKGKRLREIADDLMPGPGAATSMDDGSRKRAADEISGNDGDSSSKAQKTDGPFPDTEKSDAVDPVVFGLPDYFEVVKNPMHLLLVKKKLENAVYTDMASFERDVKLVFENAILYNGEESEVGTLAKTMMGVFEKEYKKVCEGM
ncbi:MAG: hypothetical protein SGARI_000394, partial [Bacillariaceae sp.]